MPGQLRQPRAVPRNGGGKPAGGGKKTPGSKKPPAKKPAARQPRATPPPPKKPPTEPGPSAGGDDHQRRLTELHARVEAGLAAAPGLTAEQKAALGKASKDVLSRMAPKALE